MQHQKNRIGRDETASLCNASPPIMSNEKAGRRTDRRELPDDSRNEDRDMRAPIGVTPAVPSIAGVHGLAARVALRLRSSASNVAPVSGVPE